MLRAYASRSAACCRLQVAFDDRTYHAGGSPVLPQNASRRDITVLADGVIADLPSRHLVTAIVRADGHDALLAPTSGLMGGRLFFGNRI